MTTTPSSDMMSFTPAQLFQVLVSKVTTEDPLVYLDSAYKSVNPGMLEHAISEAKEKFKELNKKTDQKKLNCYLTIGGDSYNQSFWNGCIATLLWLQDYLDIAKHSFHINNEEIQTCKNVLSRIQLPKVTDVTIEGTDIKTISNCRHYAAFLSSVAHWCTSGISRIKTSESAHTNMEMVRLLGTTALNHFPSVPFAAYFIGQIHNNDPCKCAEAMASVVDFSKYMSAESLEINDPKLIVQTDNSPVIGTVTHPLTNTIIGQNTASSFEWLGMFSTTDEFDKICISNGLTSQDVKKYILTNDETSHSRNVQHKDKIALFVESQHLTKSMIALREKSLVH